MKFEEALIELRKGKRIKRDCWVFPFYDNEENEEHCGVEIGIDDILSNDWIVEDKPGKTFPEVFEAFKEGKSIRRKGWANMEYRMNKYIEGDIFISSKDFLSTDWMICVCVQKDN